MQSEGHPLWICRRCQSGIPLGSDACPGCGSTPDPTELPVPVKVQSGSAPNSSETAAMPELAAPPGWYPDPGGTGVHRWFDGQIWTEHLAPRPVPPRVAHLDASFPLDQAVAEDLASGVRWGIGQAVWAYAAILVAIIPAVIGEALHWSTTSLELPGELSLGIGVWLAGRRVARQRGGWATAFGLGSPKRSDLKPAAAFAGVQIVARIVVAFVLVLALPSLRRHPASNVPDTHAYAVLILVQFAVAAILVAPLVEETQFRGIILRALMRRWGFRSSAAVSAVGFGILHAPGATTGAGALALALMMSVFGYVQCVLVRRTGRLAPAMIVHGLANGLAIAVALA